MQMNQKQKRKLQSKTNYINNLKNNLDGFIEATYPELTLHDLHSLAMSVLFKENFQSRDPIIAPIKVPQLLIDIDSERYFWRNLAKKFE